MVVKKVHKITHITRANATLPPRGNRVKSNIFQMCIRDRSWTMTAIFSLFSRFCPCSISAVTAAASRAKTASIMIKFLLLFFMGFHLLHYFCNLFFTKQMSLFQNLSVFFCKRNSRDTDENSCSFVRLALYACLLYTSVFSPSLSKFGIFVQLHP